MSAIYLARRVLIVHVCGECVSMYLREERLEFPSRYSKLCRTRAHILSGDLLSSTQVHDFAFESAAFIRLLHRLTAVFKHMAILDESENLVLFAEICRAGSPAGALRIQAFH